MSNTFAHMKTDKPVRVKSRRMTARQQREVARIEAALPGIAHLDLSAVITRLED